MIDLDCSRFSPDVANILMLRGADLPSFQWQNKPNQAAKDMLERIMEDTALFRRDSLADERMSAAVRALLYLWNGWLAECNMYAQAAPDKERVYLSSLCERHASHPHEAKALLQQLDDHPIYERLMSYTLEAIGLGTDPPLKRFKQMLELGQVWEPFAFVDLYEQSRAGKHCHSTEQTVQGIQCREFELLFLHCYEGATGERYSPRAEAQPERPRKRIPKPTRRSAKPPASQQAAPDRKPPNPPKRPLQPKGPRVGVICPQCSQMATLPDSRRGTKERCGKCGACFLVPQRNAPAKSTPSTRGNVAPADASPPHKP